MPGEEDTARGTQWRDISLPLSAALPGIPGDPPFRRELFLSQEADGCEAASWGLSAHAGTHLDFPAHFLPGGRRAGDYPAAAFFLPARVVDAGEFLALGPELLDAGDAAPGEAVLFRTVNSATRAFLGPAFPEAFAALTPALAMRCVRQGLALVGIDALSVEPLDDPGFPVHHILLEAGVLILEGLFLADVAPGRYLLSCPPLRVSEAEASPVRAVLGPADYFRERP